jgi:hypothetical protein
MKEDWCGLGLAAGIGITVWGVIAGIAWAILGFPKLW